MPTDLIQQIARFALFCALNYSKLVLMTAVVTAIMAGVLLILRHYVLREENWLNYLGIAFAVFGVQYGFRAYAALQRAGDYTQAEPRFVDKFAQAIFSNLNSILFVAAAFALLYWVPPLWARIGLAAVFVSSAIAGLLLREPWNRRLDALLSAAVLLLVSWAMYRNSGTRQRHGWALLNLLGGLLYSLLHIVYGFVPNLARSRRFVPLVDKPLQSIGMTPADALDVVVFALAFVLKFLLFFGALLVVIRCLSAFSPSVTRKILEPVKAGRGEFLASNGIVRAMAESIGADAAALSFRLPGAKRDEVVTLTWERETLMNVSAERTEARPLPEQSTIGRTLVADDIVSSRNWRADRRFRDGGFIEAVPNIRSFLNMPLLYHGATVGCLNFEWKKPGAYTASEVQRVRQIADYVTPVVQTERWLRAIGDLRERLQFYNFDSDERKAGRFIGRVVSELHDVLAPQGTLLLFEFGFDAQWAMCIEGKALASSDDRDERRCCEAIETEFRSNYGVGTDFIEIAMPLMGITVGKILLAARRYRDELTHPSLTTDRKQLSTIAVLIKDALLDLHRGRFGLILHDLHTDLDVAGFASEAHWLRTLRDGAEEAGLKSVTVYPDKTGRLYDQPNEVTALNVSEFINGTSKRVEDRRVFRHPDTAGVDRAVLELPLPLCGETLYLEIDRADFGRELEAELPWKVFFDRLVDAADSALVRIRALELESDAMEFEMNSLLVHELRSPAEEFQQAVEWLDENLLSAMGLPPDDSRRMMFDELKRSAWKFMELANAVVKPVSPDNRSAVPLTEVRDRVDKLYSSRLAAHGIKLTWQIGDGWIIGVPLHLAYIVLASLVQNAREAIGDRRGRIHVQGEVSLGDVMLHVDDDGPGIPEQHRPNIFKLGFTTKKRGSGRGLVLAQRALHRHKGDLRLAQGPAGVSTRFTVRFPRS